MLTATCPFPLAHSWSVGLWLVVAVLAGFVTGRKMIPHAEMSPDAYRRRYRHAPATSIAAQLLCLIVCAAVLAMHATGVADFCANARRQGLLLISPWCVTALIYGLPWMVRVVRRERRRGDHG